MNYFYVENPIYIESKINERCEIRPDVDNVQDIRQRYKIITGKAISTFLRKHNFSDICTHETIACWCGIARESAFFNESFRMIECIMIAMLPNGEPCLDLDLFRKTARSKPELNVLIRIARKEAQDIRELYNKIGKFDPHYNGNDEYRKIRKALSFIKTAICVCIYNKLPTVLTVEEHNELVRLSNSPETVSKRYRLDNETGNYIRVGGLRRKRAYRLFGIRGCTVLLKKTIGRYEKTMAGAFKV